MALTNWPTSGVSGGCVAGGSWAFSAARNLSRPCTGQPTKAAGAHTGNPTCCGNLRTIKGASVRFGEGDPHEKPRAPAQGPRQDSCSFAVGAIASVGPTHRGVSALTRIPSSKRDKIIIGTTGFCSGVDSFDPLGDPSGRPWLLLATKPTAARPAQLAREKGTLPMDQETFTENVPSDAKGGCELEGKHEQSMLSVSQWYTLCRDGADPCGFAEKGQPVPAPTPSPSKRHCRG